MKINFHHNIPPVGRKINRFLGKRNKLGLGSLGLVGLLLLFFIAFNYGGHLYKTAQTQYLNQTLKQLVNLDFSFLNNYAKGQFAALDEVKIDLKFKHLMRLNYLREQAAKERFIRPAYKDESFPAQLTYQGKTYQVKMSLTGKMSREHLGHPSKWSFQVKVKGSETIAGMRRFGLLIPTARGNLTDWLSFELMKEKELMGLRVDFVSVSINGKSNGIFYLEERFDKHLIENNRLREGIIFKLEKELKPYGEAKLMQDPATRAQLLLLKQMWQEVASGELPPHQFFDLKKMAKLFAIADLLNNQHPLSKENLRFYFNPVTGLVEPIAREFQDLEKKAASPLHVFLEKPSLYTSHFWHRQESIIGLIYNNADFKRHYIAEAEMLINKEYLDDFFTKRAEKLEVILQKVYRTWPYYSVPKAALYKNQARIKSILSPEKEALLAYFGKKSGDYLSLHFRNQDLPLNVLFISLQDSIFFYPEKTVIVDSEVKDGIQLPQPFRFKIPPGVTWDDNLIPNLKVHYQLLGSNAGEKVVQVITENKYLKSEFALPNVLADSPSHYGSFDFIQVLSDGNTLHIPAGKWVISEDLLIPRQKRLQIAAGAEIDLVNGSKIISYSPISSFGTKEQPVIIQSTDASGKGLLVFGATERSFLSYTYFKRLVGSRYKNTRVESPVCFYQTPVTIFAGKFSQLLAGESYLQILETDYSIDEASFTNIKANALVTYAGNGKISNTRFVNIGENAIDASASTLQLNYLYLNGIGDIGIRIAEKSEVKANWIDLRQAQTGIVGVDESIITLSDIKLSKSQTGLSILENQWEYGPAQIVATRLHIEETKSPYYLSPHSTLILNGRTIQKNGEELEKPYIQAEFGKGIQ